MHGIQEFESLLHKLLVEHRRTHGGNEEQLIGVVTDAYLEDMITDLWLDLETKDTETVMSLIVLKSLPKIVSTVCKSGGNIKSLIDIANRFPSDEEHVMKVYLSVAELGTKEQINDVIRHTKLLAFANCSDRRYEILKRACATSKEQLDKVAEVIANMPLVAAILPVFRSDDFSWDISSAIYHNLSQEKLRELFYLCDTGEAAKRLHSLRDMNM